MKRKAKAPKPRNPFAMHAAFRSGAGVHDKPHKGKRAAEKAPSAPKSKSKFTETSCVLLVTVE